MTYGLFLNTDLRFVTNLIELVTHLSNKLECLSLPSYPYICGQGYVDKADNTMTDTLASFSRRKVLKQGLASCCKAVTSCCKAVTKLFQSCYKAVTKSCCKAVAKSCCKAVASCYKLLQSCYKLR